MATQPQKDELKKLPTVGRVLGARLEPSGPHGQWVVFVQYRSRSNELCELEMPLGDAMYLLTALREIEKDSQKAPS